MSARPRTARWIALEQAQEHEVLLSLEKLGAGILHPLQVLDMMHAYGEHVAERAHDLGRHAAEQRARRRIKAAGVS